MRTSTPSLLEPAAWIECAPDVDPTLAAITRAVGGWLPCGFVAVAATASTRLPIPDADRALVSRAVARRRAEFIGGRWCAHRALALIGSPAASLPAGSLGGPAWPRGVIGSITHERSWCLAVAGPAGRVGGIGIDLCGPMRQQALRDVAPLVLTQAEAQRDGESRVQAVFCIKEAAVKAVSASAGRFLELHDIELELDGDRFRACIAGVPARVDGRHGAIDGHAFALAKAVL